MSLPAQAIQDSVTLCRHVQCFYNQTLARSFLPAVLPYQELSQSPGCAPMVPKFPVSVFLERIPVLEPAPVVRLPSNGLLRALSVFLITQRISL